MILTENWYSYEKHLNTKEILTNLKAKIERRLIAVQNADDASVIIRRTVRILARLLNKSYHDEKEINELATYLSQDYGLYIALSSQRGSKRRLRNQTIDLIAYILINQILFYFLYSKRGIKQPSKGMMKEISHPEDLIEYFDSIREIDFQPIFDIKVASKIPYNQEIVKYINDIIGVLLEALRIDEIKHDLYGRLIGKALPSETRQILASYYTRVAPAHLLANLVISNHNDTVWDPACGSGTLLVASYERKKHLFQIERRILDAEDKAKLHTRFVEKELTGTDIMPFACHLASLNLSAQNLAVSTNSTRICHMNSLRIHSLEEPIEVPEAYGDIYRELHNVTPVQRTLGSFSQRKRRKKAKSKNVLLSKTDCVVVNPPFTKLRRMPKTFRDTLKRSPIRAFAGAGRTPLWAYFLSLTDKILVDGGRVGAIIPISLLHGKDTQRIRTNYFETYTVEYIIRPAKKQAFSEDSSFGDIIFVAKKTKPRLGHKVKIVLLKNNSKEQTIADIQAITRDIATALEPEIETDELSMYEIEQSKLVEELGNLMPYVFTSDETLRRQVFQQYSALVNHKQFERLKSKSIQKGYQFRPKGSADTALITRKLSDNRIKRAKLFFDNDT